MEKTILKIQSFPHYDVRIELVDKSWGGSEFEMKSAYSKQGGYIGSWLAARRLVQRYGIIHFEVKTGCKTVSIGYSPARKKWYGWSHRAIFGFKPGSKCKKGHCHYRPKNKKDFREDSIRFWKDKHHTNVTAKYAKNGVQVNWLYDKKVLNKKLRSTIGGVFCEYPKDWGRGEWIAKTWADAKQMAIDFSDGVS